MSSNLLCFLRDKISKSNTLASAISPVMTTCQKGVASYGYSTTAHTINNISSEFYTQTYEETRHFWPFLFHRDEVDDLLSELRPTDTFYDIGAHVGMFTCYATQKVSEGEVVAFEPVQSNINRLRENLRQNSINPDVYSIHSVALSDEPKLLWMDVDSNEPGTIGHLTKTTAAESETIKSVEGNEYIQENNIPLPDVIKMDVEGAECKVLRGLEDSLSECRLIYSEVADHFLQRFNDSEEELIGTLQEMGFEVEYLSEDDTKIGDLKAIRDV